MIDIMKMAFVITQTDLPQGPSWKKLVFHKLLWKTLLPFAALWTTTNTQQMSNWKNVHDWMQWSWAVYCERHISEDNFSGQFLWKFSAHWSLYIHVMTCKITIYCIFSCKEIFLLQNYLEISFYPWILFGNFDHFSDKRKNLKEHLLICKAILSYALEMAASEINLFIHIGCLITWLTNKS